MATNNPSTSTATRLPPLNIDVSTPQGLAHAYALGAGECLKDAQVLQEQLFSDRTGHYIITLHAIELGLKAFLISNGYSEETLSARPFGHNLVALLNAAKTKGMTLITPDAEGLIETINEWHCKDVKLRYEFTKQRTLPMCAVLIPLAIEIIQKTSLPATAIVDRVSSINPDNTVFEVHSVGLNTDPYIFAHWLVKLDRKRSKSGNRYLVELKDGNSFSLSADEIVRRAVATGLPPL
jgi:hypothetical protein